MSWFQTPRPREAGKCCSASCFWQILRSSQSVTKLYESVPARKLFFLALEHPGLKLRITSPATQEFHLAMLSGNWGRHVLKLPLA